MGFLGLMINICLIFKKIKLFAKVNATSYIPTDRVYNLQLFKISPTINSHITIIIFTHLMVVIFISISLLTLDTEQLPFCLLIISLQSAYSNLLLILL